MGERSDRPPISDQQAIEITRALCDMARDLVARDSFSEVALECAAKILIEQARAAAAATTSPASPSGTGPRRRR